VAGRKVEGDRVAISAMPVRWIENAMDAVCCRKPEQLVDKPTLMALQMDPEHHET
jgi:hypothetical protein